jgi:hypothetical protein
VHRRPGPTARLLTVGFVSRESQELKTDSTGACFEMSRTLTTTVVLAGLLTGVPAAYPIGPLDPPVITDMKIIGRLGTSRNWYTSGLALNGRYLYCGVGCDAGLKTLDVSDPSNMVLTGEWIGSTNGSGQTNSVAIKGSVLYLSNWAPNVGLRVFSLANPAQPALIRTNSTTAHTWDVEVSGNLMFVTITNGLDPPDGGIAGINIYDITNASNPTLLTFIDAGMRLVGNAVQYDHDLYFTSKRWLNVYEISDPTSPQFVRRLSFMDLAGTSRVRGNYLYVTEGGGIHTFSLLPDPSDPQEVAYLAIDTRMSCFTDNYSIGEFGSSSEIILDLTDPANPARALRFDLDWPGAGDPGLTGDVVTDGQYAFVAAGEDGNKPDCPNFDECPYFGGRVYAVHAFVPRPPIVTEVTPDPDSVYAGRLYSRQLRLAQGTPLPSWAVVQGPVGAQVDSNGMVSGWTPTASEIGGTATICVRAANSDGSDDECWQIKVKSIADFDYDDDADQGDFGIFQQCLSGAESYPTGCQSADFNGDGHVEGADMAVFLTCMAGPGLPPGC